MDSRLQPMDWATVVAVPKKLLLVGAETRTTRLLAYLLHADGYEVEVCTGAAAALVRTARTCPDALIIDTSPGGGLSADAVRKLQQTQPDRPTFVITSHPQFTDAFDPHLAAKLQIFVKPLDYAALLRALAARCPHDLG